MRKRLRWIAVLTTLLVVGTGVHFFTQTASATEEKKSTMIPVSVETVQEGSLEEILYTMGEIAPAATYQVATVSAGEVEKVMVAVGDRVSSGEVLFSMKRQSFDVTRSTTMAQLDESLAQAKRQLDLATETLEDQRRLYDEGALARSALDQAQMNEQNARSAYQSALANRRQTANNLSDQEDQYLYKSPIDGVVVAGSLATGQKVGAGQGFTVIAGDALEVVTSVSSRHIQKVSVGQKAHLAFLDRKEPVQAKVERIGLLPSRGVYPVTLSIERSDDLLPGMVADVTLVLDEIRESVVIPQGALLSMEAGEVVYVVEGDVARRKPVKTGTREKGQVVIREGLRPGDQLVVAGQAYLDDGTPVVVD